MPGQQGADGQLPAPDAGREHGLDLRRDAGGVDDLLERRQRDHGRAAPSSRTACGLAARLQPGDEVAEPLGAADPGRAHERGQPQQLRRSRPARSRAAGRCPAGAARLRRPARDQRVREVPAARIRAAADQGASRRTPRRPAAGPGSGPAPARRAAAARGPARSRRRTGSATSVPRTAQVAADQPGARPQADQPGRAHPPLRRGLGVRQREEPGDLRRGCTAPSPAPGAAAGPPGTAAARPGGR